MFWTWFFFQIYIYFKKLFFWIFALCFLIIWFIIYRQSDNWNINFSIYYLLNVELVACVVLWIGRWCSKHLKEILKVISQSNFISQLIKGKSRDLQKLLKCFSWITTSMSDLLLLSGVLCIIFTIFTIQTSWFHTTIVTIF